MVVDTGCCVAYSTVSSKEQATEMARKLVEDGCVACVNILGPVESVYRWKGQIEHAAEWMLMMKCSTVQVPRLKMVLVGLHDYEMPELLVTAIADGHAPYLEWIRSSGVKV